MLELKDILQRLGLSEYLPVLIHHGFEDWLTLIEIRDDDFEKIGIRRCHQRLLQKEIEKYRREQSSFSRANPNYNSMSPTPPTLADNITPLDNYLTLPRRFKRKYRWHPRPDPYAPKRPKTAYVRFADLLRTDPTIRSLPFVEIAKEVGRRWRNMEPKEKQRYEVEVAQDLQKYEDALHAYKLTPMYQEYQRYLQQFRKSPSRPTRTKIKIQPSHKSSELPGSKQQASGNENWGLPINGSSQRSRDVSAAASSLPTMATVAMPAEFQQLLIYASAEYKRLESGINANVAFMPVAPQN